MVTQDSTSTLSLIHLRIPAIIRDIGFRVLPLIRVLAVLKDVLMQMDVHLSRRHLAIDHHTFTHGRIDFMTGTK